MPVAYLLGKEPVVEGHLGGLLAEALSGRGRLRARLPTWPRQMSHGARWVARVACARSAY